MRSSATRRRTTPGTPNPVAGSGPLGDLRGQLAVGHVPARVHQARVQPGRERAHRVGGQQSEHRGARDRPEPAIRAAGRHRVALRARHRGAASGGKTGTTRRADAATSGAARSLPRHEHVPEDHGDVRRRRNLEPARVVHARGHRRQGRHSAAGQRAPLLFPRRARTAAAAADSAARSRRPAAASCRRILRRARRCERR